MDARCKRIRMYAFTDVNVYVWTGPENLGFESEIYLSFNENSDDFKVHMKNYQNSSRHEVNKILASPILSILLSHF